VGSSAAAAEELWSWGSWLDSGSSDVGAVLVVAEAGTGSVRDLRYDEVKDTRTRGMTEVMNWESSAGGVKVELGRRHGSFNGNLS
jgi:hypothetical protein